MTKQAKAAIRTAAAVRTTKTRVVGYVRVSTAEQADEGVSLDAQRARLTAYCTALDLELVCIEADEGRSAKSLKRRPGLDRALAALTEGRADALLIPKLDRLTRSVRDLGTLVETYFDKDKFELLSVADSIDTRTAGGRLVLNVLVSVSQWEREAIGERTGEALGYLRTEGVKLGGPALGWRHSEAIDTDGRRVIETVECEARTVERILELRAAKYTMRAVCETLTREKHLPKRGGRWYPMTIKRVLER